MFALVENLHLEVIMDIVIFYRDSLLHVIMLGETRMKRMRRFFCNFALEIVLGVLSKCRVTVGQADRVWALYYFSVL